MEKGLSNLAFPRLNLSSMRSCESVDVELWGGAQILTMCQKAVRHTAIGMQLKSTKRDLWRRTEGGGKGKPLQNEEERAVEESKSRNGKKIKRA